MFLSFLKREVALKPFTVSDIFKTRKAQKRTGTLDGLKRLQNSRSLLCLKNERNTLVFQWESELIKLNKTLFRIRFRKFNLIQFG